MSCRLLYVVGELHTGGSERQLWYLLRAMDRERYKPAVAVWNYCERDIHVAPIRALDVPLYTFPHNRSRMGKLRAFRGLIKKLQPEVVHSWSFYTNFAAYWAAKGTHAISLGSIRSDFLWAVKECGSVVGNLSARWPRNQICNSAVAAAGVRRAKGYFRPAEVSVVRNGIDLNTFAPSPVPLRQPVRILGIGYLLPVKRWDRVLAATERLKREGADFVVKIAGDGPLRLELERKAVELGVADQVQFIGHIDNVSNLLANAAFVVHTADAEGYPNAVMEATAVGRAVVATDAGDISSLINDGETGFVVPRGNDEVLVERMARLVADFHLCNKMGQAARAKAEREFGLDRLVRETLQVYRSSGWRDT